MNKRFNISLVLENDTLFPETNQPTQTPEEIQHELDGLESSMERQLEIHKALEDLAEIAATIETPTPREVALFQTAANMAVAGTDNEATDILPAIEAFKPLALEGFTDKIKDSIKKIIQYFKDMINKFTSWVKDFFNNKYKKFENDLKVLEKLVKIIPEDGRPNGKPFNPSKLLYVSKGDSIIIQQMHETINTNLSKLFHEISNFQKVDSEEFDLMTDGNIEAVSKYHADLELTVGEIKTKLNNDFTLLHATFVNHDNDNKKLITFLRFCHEKMVNALNSTKEWEGIFTKNIKEIEQAQKDLENKSKSTDNAEPDLNVDYFVNIGKFKIKRAQINLKLTNVCFGVFSDFLSESIHIARNNTK